MPKASQTRKEVNAPPELVAAADAALDSNILPRKAMDLIKYLIMVAAVKRANGNEAEAARRLGMTRAALNQGITLLEARLV
jgi:transcriptional regulator with GAF, ATPase, and Fis domain